MKAGCSWISVVIRLSILALFVFCNPSFLNADNFYGFEKVIYGPTRSVNYNAKPVKIEANTKGGVLVVDMPDSAGTCSGHYRFTWKFLDDVSKLEAGKEYRLSVRGDMVKGNCKRNHNIMHIKGSMDGSLLAGKKGITKRGKYISIEGKGGHNLVAYPTKAQNFSARNSVDVKVAIKQTSIRSTPDRDFFTFSFNFSSHPYSSTSKLYYYDIVYVYKKNHVPTGSGAGGPVNCPAVFRLGIQLGMLNLATYRNEDAKFCVKILGYAIEGAKGSGCVPADDLIDLQKRMKGAKSSSAFHQEVLSLQTKYLGLVDGNCGCSAK